MTRFLAALALGASLAGPALAQDPTPMTPDARAQLRAEVKAYLLDHPEIIMEAIQVLEQRRKDAAVEKDRSLVKDNAAALFRAPGDHVRGNPDGDVTVVEFTDYRCGYCKRAHPAINQLLELDPDVKLVVKEFPILGPASVSAARIAVAAQALDPAKYQALNTALMGYDGNLTEIVAWSIAKDVGYDIPALKEKAASPEIDEKIRATYALAQKLGLEGTPSFVIGDQVIRGFLPLEELLAAVDDARQGAGAATAN